MATEHANAAAGGALDRSVPSTATRWASRTQFFCAGFIFATWGVHIPTVKAHYGIDEAQLGLALLAAGVGALLGAINGALINFTKLHPFIITLGTQSIFRGVTMIISDAKPIFGFPQSFKTAFGGMIGGKIPMPVVWALLVAAILWFVTTKSKMGRNFYALGGNKEAAWFSGINVRLHTLLVHIISGICAGICGVVMIARLGSAEPMAGSGHETFAIAAAIIGGTSFFGGKGKIPNVIVGALIIGLINNALNMLSVETYFQQVATGALIIGAVTLDMFISRKK